MAVILAMVLVRREFKTVIERLFVYLLIATLVREIILVSNVEHQFEYEQMDEVCSIVGALNLSTAVSVIIIVATTIIYLLSRVVIKKQVSRAFAKMFEFGVVLLSFLVPLIVSAGLLYTDVFGFSTAWCWVREYDSTCHKTSIVKKILGGYSVILLTGVLSIVLTTAIVVIYYKIAQRIRQATLLLKQALILITCLILNTVIVIFAAIVISLTAVNLKIFLVYTYTVAISLYDLIYPLGFLISLKCQAVLSYGNRTRRRSTYSPLPRSVYRVTVPPSDRVSARSTTVPITAPYTGQFTAISEAHV